MLQVGKSPKSEFLASDPRIATKSDHARACTPSPTVTQSGPVSKFSDPVNRVDRAGVAIDLNFDSACASTAGNRARFRSTVTS